MDANVSNSKDKMAVDDEDLIWDDIERTNWFVGKKDAITWKHVKSNRGTSASSSFVIDFWWWKFWEQGYRRRAEGLQI